MAVQQGGEVVFGPSDWARRYGGTRFGVKIRDFGDGGKVAQLWEQPTEGGLWESAMQLTLKRKSTQET